jgi:hypothetical protein
MTNHANLQSITAKAYNPLDHLIQIKSKDGSLKDYYPAGWRLYELNLRYEEANFSSEILLMDVERNLAVVKCRLYLGPDYEMSHKKTESLKSGLLSQLDKVETAAKARCARDFGCGTEYAMEYDDSEIVEVIPRSVEQAANASSNGHTPNHLETAQRLFASTFNVPPERLAEKWTAYKVNILGAPVDDSDLTAEQLARVHGSIVAMQKEQAQRNGQQHKPVRTAETVQAFYAKVYQIQPQELEAKWTKFVLGVAGRSLSKGPLTEDELNKLNSVISQAWQRQKAASDKAAA